MKCSDGQYFVQPQVNIGDDAAETFLEQVLAAATICRQHLANNIPRKRLTQEQCREYNNATNCSICAKLFKSKDKKVCDHMHLTGEYRGPAHNACNLNYCFHIISCLISKLFTRGKKWMILFGWFLCCTGCNDAKRDHIKHFSSLFWILRHAILIWVLSVMVNN